MPSGCGHVDGSQTNHALLGARIPHDQGQFGGHTMNHALLGARIPPRLGTISGGHTMNHALLGARIPHDQGQFGGSYLVVSDFAAVDVLSVTRKKAAAATYDL